MNARCAAAAALLLALAVPATVRAQQDLSPQEKAEQLNNEGKDLFRGEDFAGAADKFRQAIMFSPEGRFYFNLCYTLDKMGNYREAMTACQAVEPNGASIPLQKKTDELMTSIRERMGDSGPTGGGQTGGGQTGGGQAGGGQAGGGQTGGGPPPPGGGQVEQPAPPTDSYAWAIGGELGPLNNNLGSSGSYDESGVLVKLFLNFLVSDVQRIGLQGYLDISEIGDGALSDPLEIVDIGGAIYKHFPFGGSFAFTPLVGVHLGLMRPGDFAGEQTAVAVGLRADLQLAWMFGSYKEHQISAGFTLNGYSAASSGNIDTTDWDLDQPGSTTAFTVGYTYRFSTPFGQSPVFTLE